MFGWKPQPTTETPNTESAFYVFERDTEETPHQSGGITEDSCCWCFPGTQANSVCAYHENAMIQASRERHRH